MTFSKGLVDGFCRKVELFSFAFFGVIKSEKNVFYILDKKECLLDQKINVLKRAKK